MKNKTLFYEMAQAFFVCTTCITLLEGIIGMLFFPEQALNYGAFFSPPLFGIFSVLLGFVTYSSRELTVKEVIVRRVIHLLLIEALVFGLNAVSGHFFEPFTAAVLACSIAVVFVSVYVVLWLWDRRSAEQFNVQLKHYQNRQQSEKENK